MKHRVLIVDDYPDAADIASALLTLLGHTCVTAHSGLEAIQASREFDPDVAIVDIGLPDISGYEVARTLREQTRSHGLYLAAITGWGQPADRAKAFAAGFDEHVLKPANGTKLRDILTRADLMTVTADGSDRS